jgi:hypothetical protein
MFANGFGKIYYYHLKKCGGTTLGAWFSSHVPDAGLPSWSWQDKYLQPEHFGGDVPAALRSTMAAAAFASGCIASHLPFHDLLPADTFFVTVLREPRRRLISQVSDWRREAHQPHPEAHPEMLELFRDAERLSLADFLNACLASRRRHLFDNYLTRALATHSASEHHWQEPVSEATLDRAVAALRSGYHVVGLTERLVETKVAICNSLGLVPTQEEGERQNVSKSSSRIGADEIAAAEPLIQQLTAFDTRLYAEAQALFDERHAPVAAQYDETQFETRFAEQAVRRLTPLFRDESVVFTVSDALVGTGLHCRDRVDVGENWLWTGPERRTVLYMPVPQGIPITVMLWVRAYASEAQRASLQLSLDDAPVEHRFLPAEGWREIIAASAVSRRPFMKLTITVGETLTAAEAKQPEPDNRKRGLLFDRYGWRPQ